MSAHPENPNAELARDMVRDIRKGRLDAAEAKYNDLCQVDADFEQLLAFPVVIAIQRGHIREALQHLNTLPGDPCPELRALCLCLLGDPSWHGIAMSLEDSPDPYVSKAMRQMLGRPLDS
jgi:hypothetical protein